MITISLTLALALAACRPTGTDEYRPSKRALEFNNKAVRALNLKDYEQALSLVKEALTTDPGFYKAQANQAAILQAMGRDAEAIDTLRDLIEKRPAYADAYVPLGVLLERTGRLEEATTYYRKGLELHDAILAKNPDDTEAAKNRAAALYLLNEPADALKVLRTLVEKDPGNESARILKSRIESGDREAFLGMKKPDDPKPDAEKADSTRP